MVSRGKNSLEHVISAYAWLGHVRQR